MKNCIIVVLLSLIIISCGRKPDEQEPPVVRNFSSFVFVGMKGNLPGLYKFNIKKNTVSEFWNSNEEEVVELSYSSNHHAAFFITATKTGKEGIFPFIKDARLYVISDSTSTPRFVNEIGSGLQVFSRWESETVFRIVMNYWDKKVSTYINQRTIIFNTYGRILQEETKTYDVITDGYPRLPNVKPDSLSPAGRFQISYNEGTGDSVFLVQSKNKHKDFITVIDNPINEISWSDDRSFVFLSTFDLSSDVSSINRKPGISSLYAYSISDKSLIRKWAGAGRKNFFTISDFLIFDNGFGRNSVIYIYDFKKDKIIKQIKLKGGCGLNGIPENPQSGT